MDQKQFEQGFELLFSFECEQNGRSYMAYTDHSVDESGAERVFAARYSEDGRKIEPVNSMEEWEMIREILEGVQNGLDGAQKEE